MRGAVLADEPRPIHREEHRQVVLAHVVNRLVEGPLQERRVQRHDRPHSADREAACHGDGVLLGDAHVVEAVREGRLELGEARPGGHARRDRHDPAINPSQLDELGHEDRRVARVLRGARGGRWSKGVAVRAGAVGAPGPDLGRPVGEIGGSRSRAVERVGTVGARSIGGSAAPWNETWSASAGR